MKIAIVAPTEIPARRANTLQVMKMAQAFSAEGHPVRLAAPSARRPRNPTDFPASDGGHSTSTNQVWEDLARHYGLKHPFAVEWLYSNPRLRRYDYGWRAVSWARRWQASLLYTRLPQAATISSLLGFPTILEVHDIPCGTAGPWIFRKFLQGKGARRLVIITQALASDLSDRFGREFSPPFVVIAPDGVDLERYQHQPGPEQAREALARASTSGPPVNLHPDRFTVGYTGHLYSGRGGNLLLELAGCLPDISFLIVGGEPEQVNAMQADADSRGLENLLLTGFVPNADLPLYQAACDVLLMPYQEKVEASSGGDISRYLSPMKLFEYLACERAIVSSDLPVLQEVLNHENAVLLPSGSPQAWVKAIRDLELNPELRLRLARHARQDASRYTWEARVGKILTGLM
jgi:glycosyltransferase involved in cell wall biosynthesis